jgi:hypothetical protein
MIECSDPTLHTQRPFFCAAIIRKRAITVNINLEDAKARRIPLRLRVFEVNVVFERNVRTIH